MSPELHELSADERTAWKEKQRERLRAELATSPVPEHLRGGLLRWMVDGIRPGDFLCAILRNDLHDAERRADPTSRLAMTAIHDWLYNFAPCNCWRSVTNFARWRGIDRDPIEGD